MSFTTPAALRVKADVAAQFPGVQFGVYNRRHLNNDPTRAWSQHSWPNALDIYFTTPAGDTSASHQLMLDRVARFIRDRYMEYNVRYLLWRTDNHYDHIHVDFYPWGIGTPSLTRGGADNRYKTRSGTIITQAQLEEGEDELAILSEAEQNELKDFLRFIREEGSSVGFVKYAIRLIRKERGLPLHAPVEIDLDDYEIIIQRKEV